MSTTHELFRPRDTSLLAAALQLGPVRLSVRSLERSVEFYRNVVGVEELGRGDGVATLGVDEPVLELVEGPDAVPAGKHAGLYHVALLYPSRLELARVGQRIIASGTPLQGAADHGTHEAFYLPDPDGNGLELAADRPREQWRPYHSDNPRSFMPQPMDVAGLMDLVERGSMIAPRAEPGLRVGHLHLHVGSIEEAARFWEDVVGFDEMFRMDSALFVAAGGYHHHLGLNVWKGEDVPAAPSNAIGMRWFTARVPSAADLGRLGERLRDAGADHDVFDGEIRLRDPWKHELRVSVSE